MPHDGNIEGMLYFGIHLVISLFPGKQFLAQPIFIALVF
jgi:hypothetical protein